MRNSVHLEDHNKQEYDPKRYFGVRINLFFFATFALFSVLIVRLAILQFVHGAEMKAAESKQETKPVVIAPIRGNIYDKNGAPIASTISAQSVFYRIEPNQKNEEKIAFAKRLEEVFARYGTADKLTAAEIIEKMDVGIDIEGNPAAKKPSYTFMPRRIKTNLSKAELAYLAEHRDELRGLEVTEESTRFYDSESIAVQMVGYMRPFSTASNQKAAHLSVYKNKEGEYLNDEFVGFDGLEYMYQDELRGQNGYKIYPINASAQIIGNVQIEAPKKGHNLFLTIDKRIQLATENAITSHLEKLQNSPASNEWVYKGHKAMAGYAVAMEVDTGRVVAMASMPDYDPNIWLKGRIGADELNSISYKYPNGTIRERYVDIQDNTERGKHPSSLVPPGSTLKPLTVLIGLNEGFFGPEYRYQDTGIFYYGKDNNAKVSNSDGKAWGSITPAQSLTVSSNTFMAEMIGNKLYRNKKDPLDIWDSYMKKFGLGELTGSNLPGEYKGDVYYYEHAKTLLEQFPLVNGSFGQEARYTTLQLAQYTSMLANRGTKYRPQFVERVTTYDGELVRTIEPEVLDKVDYPKAYWDVLTRGMRDVSIDGFEGIGYTVARKTGTSEQQVAGKTIDNAVFIAYAPIDKPKLAVAVVVPEGGFGKYGAAPIARHIFDAYDQYVGLDGTPKGDTTTTRP